MKDNKNGFTLIEILAVIIIIGIVALIAIPSVTGYLNSAKDTTYETYEKSMEDAAKNRIIDCINNNENCELPEGNQSLKYLLEGLIEEGYIDNMKDPESNGYCDQTLSYVTVRGSQATDFTYKACLFCGDYVTDDDSCNRINGDADLPECGLVTGESNRWTKENRTISVLCSDKTSGCEKSAFSKTFTTTTNSIEGKPGYATITISDNSGMINKCEVKAFVDKTLPTCNIDVEGDYIDSVGWYSLEALAILKNTKDEGSGILTYGMGTSLKNRDYNKKTQMTFNNGITTVIGYVKDVAGNENICAQEIRVGTEIPKFNLYYGYTLDLDQYSAQLNGLNINGSVVTTSSSTPTITVYNTDRYSEIEKIKVVLNQAIDEQIPVVIKYGSETKTGVIQPGSKEVVFLITKGTYNKLEIQLGNAPEKTYDLDRIEVISKNGSAWTNKNQMLYVEPIDRGMPTVAVSYDNGQTWSTEYTRKITSAEHNFIKTKNGIGMLSDSVEYSTLIDKVMPLATVEAKTKNTNRIVATGAWTNEPLNYTLTQSTVGESGAKIYYCYDRDNTCNPNTLVQSGQLITALNELTGIYYVRYKSVSNGGISGVTNYFSAKVDTVAPTCNITNYATITCEDTGNNPNEASKIVKWYYGKNNLSNLTFSDISATSSINMDRTSAITSSGVYNLYAQDEAGNTSAVKQQTYYTVTYNKNGAIPNPSKSSEIVKAGTTITFPTFSEDLYFFIGWNTSSSATTKLDSYVVNGDVTLYAIWKDKVYLYNRGNECTADSGGWTLNAYETNGTGSKNSDNLYIGYKTTGSSGVEYVTANSIPVGKYRVHFLYNKTATVTSNSYGYSFYKFGSPNRWFIGNNALGMHDEFFDITINTPSTFSFGNYDSLDYLYEVYLTRVTGESDNRVYITLDMNGGIISHDYLNTIEYITAMKNTSFILTTRTPSRNGYSFAGWGTSPTTSTVSYSASGVYSFGSSATLYAVWR